MEAAGEPILLKVEIKLPTDEFSLTGRSFVTIKADASFTVRDTILEVCRKIKFPAESLDESFNLFQPKANLFHGIASSSPMGTLNFDRLETVQLCQGEFSDDAPSIPDIAVEGHEIEYPDKRTAKKPMRRFGFAKGTKSMRKSRKGLFGVPLKDACPKGGFMPLMVEQILNHLSARGWGDTFPFGDEILDELNDDVQVLKNSFEMEVAVALENYSVQVVCSVLTIFFRELPEPLFTWKLYSQFVDARSDIYALNNLLDKLPKEHKVVATSILRFLKQLVFGGADASRLAKVFGGLVLSKSKDSLRDIPNGMAILRSFLIARSLSSLTGFEYNPDIHTDVPFDILLGGEQILYAVSNASYIGNEIRGKQPFGTLYISNYRLLYVYKSKEMNGIISLPLTSIWMAKRVSASKTPRATLKVLCKNFRVAQFTFVLKKDREYDLRDVLVKKALPSNVISTFAFAYEEDRSFLVRMPPYNYADELVRLKLLGGDDWRPCTINETGGLCSSLPSVFGAASDISDESVRRAAAFREGGRIACPVWRSPINGAILLRAGHLISAATDNNEASKDKLWKGGEWEQLMKETRKSWTPALDAAQKASVSKVIRHYRLSDNTSVEGRLSLPSAADLQTSYNKLFELCTSSAPHAPTWGRNLEETGWIPTLKKVCEVATRIAAQLGAGESVCISGDPGMDLEFVVSSIVQLMSDPFYRTMEGFRVLVEKEWVSMGYDFASRHINEGGEPDVAFLLFVDIAWQLWVQHPRTFSFADNFLLFLMDSVVNCRFGTFLCRGDFDRESIAPKTISFWDYVNTRGDRYDNPCFEPAHSTTEDGGWCLPTNHLILWHDYYLRWCCVPGWERAMSRISRVPKASSLQLTRLNLCGVPEAVVYCSELQTLDFEKNFLNWLHPKLGQLKKLEFCSLNHNCLTYIDVNIMKILSKRWSCLKGFSVDHNRLVSVEGLPQLASITSFNRLHLNYNELDSLPPKFEQLENLVDLQLGGNKFTVFPPQIFGLTNLSALTLESNELTECPSVSSLVNLITLSLAKNNLMRFPPDVTKLEQLSTLDLVENEIAEIPVTLVNMSSLRRLLLSKNNIATLPLTMGKMADLESLALDGNYDLTTPPLQMAVSRPLPEILSYLRELLAGSTAAFRVKSVLLGQHGIGKAALVKAIIKTSATPDTASEDGGIFVHDWKTKVSLPGLGKKEVTVSMWNFIGSMHYATHQFFLSERTVYMVAWSLALGEEKSRLSFWLESLKERLSANVPIILVGTHLDKVKNENASGQIREVREKYYDTGRFPNIRKIVVVSPTSGKGIGELRTALKNVVVTLDSVGAQLPKSFALLEEELVGRRAKIVPPIISSGDLSTIAATCGIKGEKSLQTYVEMFNAFGTIAQISDFKDFAVLDPAWLSRAYALVANAREQGCTDGILQHSALAKIWRAPEYPPYLHNSLLRLFLKSQVLLNLSVAKITRDSDISTSGESLVPSLLSFDKPEIEDKWPSFVQDVEQLSRNYQLDFKSYRFFNHIVVRILYYASECEALWQYGVMGQWQDQRFLLELLPLRKVLTVTVRGDNPSRVYRILVDIVDYFINDWFRIDAKITIPCPHCHQIHSFEPFMFALDACVQSAMQGQKDVKCFDIRPIELGLVAPELAMTEVPKILHSDIDIKEKIGEGGFASVFRGVWKKKQVAVKQLLQPEEESPLSPDDPFFEPGPDRGVRAFEEFRREVWIMSSLCHPNVVGFEGLVMEPYCIISEFLPCGNLYDFLHSDANASWALRMRIALDTAQSMKYLHFESTPPVIHRDVKSPNVLLASVDPVADVMVAKMADFGTSSRAPFLTGKMVDNPVWLAPEILQRKVYTESADVYSFGVILWELASRQSFFGECSFLSQIEDKVMNGERPNIPDDTDPTFAKMIQRSWAQDPEDRPNMVELTKELEELCLTRGFLSADQQAERQRLIDEAKHLAETAAMLAQVDASAPRESKSEEEGGGLFVDTCKTEKVEASIQCMATVRKQVWAGCSDGSIHIWHARTGKYIGSTKAFDLQVVALECVGPQVWGASLRNKAIAIYDIKTKAFVRKIEGFEVMCLATCSGGTVWAGCTDGIIRVISAKSYTVKREVKLTTGPVGALVRVGDEMWAGTDGHIHIISVSSYKQTKQLSDGHSKMIHCMRTFGNEIWSCSSDKTIIAWNTDGELLKKLEGHTSRVFWLMFDGDKVWSCSWDASIIVWNRKEKTFHREITGHHKDAISSVVRIYNDEDGLFYVWTGSWDQIVCRWASYTKRRATREMGGGDRVAESVTLYGTNVAQSLIMPRREASLVEALASHIGEGARTGSVTYTGGMPLSTAADIRAGGGRVRTARRGESPPMSMPPLPPYRPPTRGARARPVPPKRPPRTMQFGTRSVSVETSSSKYATTTPEAGAGDHWFCSSAPSQPGVLGVPLEMPNRMGRAVTKPPPCVPRRGAARGTRRGSAGAGAGARGRRGSSLGAMRGKGAGFVESGVAGGGSKAPSTSVAAAAKADLAGADHRGRMVFDESHSQAELGARVPPPSLAAVGAGVGTSAVLDVASPSLSGVNADWEYWDESTKEWKSYSASHAREIETDYTLSGNPRLRRPSASGSSDADQLPQTQEANSGERGLWQYWDETLKAWKSYGAEEASRIEIAYHEAMSSTATFVPPSHTVAPSSAAPQSLSPPGRASNVSKRLSAGPLPPLLIPGTVKPSTKPRPPMTNAGTATETTPIALDTAVLDFLSTYRWFDPNLSGADAAKLLQGKPPGTFVVRYSRQSGFVCASYSLEDGRVQHTQMSIGAEGEVCEVGTGRVWTSIEDFVDALGEPLPIQRTSAESRVPRLPALKQPTPALGAPVLPRSPSPTPSPFPASLMALPLPPPTSLPPPPDDPPAAGGE